MRGDRELLTCISPDGVLGIKLVGDIAVIPTCTALTDGRLHESRERWQDVDGRVDTLIVELAVDKDLALGDIPCQVRNRVCDI